MSAFVCGCDDKANWRCGDYPHCVYGKVERMEPHGKQIDPEFYPTKTQSKLLGEQGLGQASRFIPQLQHAQRSVGIGGAPNRAAILPTDPAERKKFPIASGFMDYFPDAVCAVANLSWIGNEQHNPGQPLHWARGKSADEPDTFQRHFMERGTFDKDGVRHTVKLAWRALAMLQKELEAALANGEPLTLPPAKG